MRQSLIDLIDKTIIYQYSLDCAIRKIDKTILTTIKDDCYKSIDDNSLIDIIYNSIIEYSFDEFDLANKKYDNLMSIALVSKLKYNEFASEKSKISYGFFGEVLLYSILMTKYKTNTLISRGYFYNPLEKSETKGYDSYHLIENSDNVELWFGEVKFRASFKDGVKSAIDGLQKAISDEYLKTNILAMVNHKDNNKLKDSKIKEIIDKWMADPLIVSIIDEVINYNMKLIYPILIVYDDKELNYDTKITNAIQHINTTFSPMTYKMSVDFEIFFMFLPLHETTNLKKEVIKCITSKKPLL
ncbi:SAVED domain-containing protein [Aliarcobacter butzleri]|uniref:Hachiman antiphage defense system protein HamA n=1 Tax=Aliarcobacter butzleri TaxID=28197 RepID=UPI00263CA7AB|nr:Hachiman antiphage defense system protein HamA [Aliarcobacter butzleri]MDN5060911.1 SAVED domain-containing protein [Aliarcobacter butzleri]